MIQDIRFALRMLLRHKGYTLVAALTLALGIGACTVIFSVVNGVLLRPLPYPDAERIVRVGESHQRDSLTIANVSYANYLDLTARTQTLAQVAATRFWTANLSDGGEPEQVTAALVSADFFPAMGVAPALGRGFTAAEDQPGNNDFVVLSYDLWQRRFGSDQGVLGKTIRLNGRNATVLGVMPPGFDYPAQAELWAPLVATGSLSDNRRSHLLQVVARLQPGITLAQARQELAAIGQSIEAQNPGVDPQLSFQAAGLQARLVEPIRPALLVFFCAVGLLLLIACANVASLQLVRAAAREKELAIRAALGAGRFRLVRQLLAESTLLALLGGLGGLLLAIQGVRLTSTLERADFPRINEVTVDGRVLVFALAVSLLTGILSGLAPVWRLPESKLYESLKEGGRGIVNSGRKRLRQGLVTAEIVLAVVLLAGAGLLLHSFVRLMQVERGFNADNVLTVNLALSRSKYDQGERITDFLNQTLARTRQIPGVKLAGVTSTLPFQGGPATSFAVAGNPAEDREPIADIRIIDTDYLRTLAIPLRSGRHFSERDTASMPPVMIINEELARRYFPGTNPLGRQITMRDWGDPLTGEIVGVVGNVKADGLDAEMRPMIYWPYPQFPNNFINLVIRTEDDSPQPAAAVKSVIRAVDREQPIAAIKTLDEIVAASVSPRRFNMLLLVGFASMALLLAAVGLYGVISYSVSQRIHEIGVRMALGAGTGEVLRLILRQGMTLALIGTGIGMLAAFGLTRLMAALLYGVSATDPLTFTVIALLQLIVAALACWWPARRATKVDPLIALRHE